MANGFTIPTDLLLNLGKYPNDGTGDDLYTAFDKIRQTFTLINSQLGVIDGENIGTGTGLYVSKVDNKLQFKTISGTGSVIVTSTADNISITAGSVVETDTSPSLGGDLDLSGNNVLGTGTPGTTGDVRATVWNIDVRDLSNQLYTLLNAPPEELDLGANWASSSSNYDFGGFSLIPV
jgi:hypothetical protein